MQRREKLYWLVQVSGWLAFVLLNVLTANVEQNLISQVYLSAFVLFVLGIIVSHVYRSFVKHQKWASMRPVELAPRMLAGTVVCGIIYTFLNGSISDLFLPGISQILEFDNFTFLSHILNFSFLFLCWNLLYFGFHLVENFRKEEIKNLELRASMTEIELSSLKSQLNPHFMFNSLNSIRALIDENPDKAKEALTLLSGILRNTLVFGRKKEVSLGEEVELVKKYLGLEKIRFEERLLIEVQMEDEILSLPFPPLMLLTIVENGIKHGISKLISGGLIRIVGYRNGDSVVLEIYNSGIYNPPENPEGIGLVNSRDRLALLYPKSASFQIGQSGDYVKAKIELPWKK